MAKAKEDKLNLLEQVGYVLLLGAAKLFGLLPYCLLYRVISPCLAFLLYRVIGYRKRVVRKNLSNAFPEMSAEQRGSVECKFYRHLADIFIDVLDLSSMSRKELARRMVIENIDEFDRQVGDKSWIAALGHYGDWEYFTVFALEHHYPNLGVYHPLSSKVFDRFMGHIRGRFGMELVPMFGLARRVMQCKKSGEQMAIGLIADQRAQVKFSDGKWRMFLNQPTLFFSGMGTYAKRFGMPVYFLDIDEVKPSHYRCNFEMLYDGQEDVDERVITDRYVARLEQMIRRRPELWLWSHNRWKQRPSAEELEELLSSGHKQNNQ